MIAKKGNSQNRGDKSDEKNGYACKENKSTIIKRYFGRIHVDRGSGGDQCGRKRNRQLKVFEVRSPTVIFVQNTSPPTLITGRVFEWTKL